MIFYNFPLSGRDTFVKNKFMKQNHTGIYLLLALLILAKIIGAQQVNDNNNKKYKDMNAIDKNKEVVRKVFEQSLNKRNMALLKELVSEDYTGLGGKKGASAFAEPVALLIQAFPDIRWDIESIIGENETVVVRWKLKGTHTSPFNGIVATGKLITNTGIGYYELYDGKIINSQVHTDRLGFLQELGVVPADVTVLSKKQNKNGVSFIDKFFVPATAKQEFNERMNNNRNFIKMLPGFLEDAAYEYTDDKGNMVCITVAHWESIDALNKAREAVQAEYKRQGFDPTEMLKRLNILVDRGVYTEVVPSQ